MISRREFCLASAASLVACGMAPSALARRLQPDSGLTARALRDGVWVIVGQGGNSLLIRTEESPVLVDTKVVAAGPNLHAEAVRQATAAPTLVINTHHHADHVGGNYAFSKDATIVAHVNVKPRMADTFQSRLRPVLEENGSAATVEDFIADIEVNSDQLIRHGGQKIVLRHFGPGHTDNDMVVLLPTLNILHMGDLVFHDLHPFIDTSARATTVGWQSSLAETLKMTDQQTIVIPGHGEITDRTGIERMSTYFDQLRSIVQEAISNGRTRDEVMALKPEAFKTRGFEQMQPQALGVVYDELNAVG